MWYRASIMQLDPHRVKVSVTMVSPGLCSSLLDNMWYRASIIQLDPHRVKVSVTMVSPGLCGSLPSG